MRRLRCYQKVRMPRHVADRHVDLVQQGVWIPCSENDVLDVQLSGSFHTLKSEELRPQAKKGSLRGEETMMPSAGPERGILVEAGTEETATGLEEGGRITKETLTRLARRWRVTASMRAAPPVDLYLPKDAFVKCGGVDEASCAAAREALEARRSASLWKTPAPVALADCAGNEEGDSVIMTRDGRLIKGVHCYEKKDVGDKGVITMVPVTMLDDPVYSKALGHLWDPFEDAYYYWQTVDIMRRLLQTGIVVLVGMIAGENAAVVFAMLVSVFAILVHQRYSPFKNDSMDDLALGILVNQFIVQLVLMLFQLTDGGSGFVVGIGILLLQIMLLTYAMTHIIPAFRPVFVKLTGKSVRIQKRISRLSTFNSSQRENENLTFDKSISNPAFSNQSQSPSTGF
ncbi:hypothetical protein CYMTET_55390 [Cymbomonas tetramitiformis]|uniref:TRP C-terminal domain-containing protein n=1 Tax=Cymbomonas tetramitiformis TaxID=36881 RepID=A0AAE0ENM8_9CHLO|nr:hypothetical protein CYMTET_55390 [Cymbomonas tetramitiformis]